MWTSIIISDCGQVAGTYVSYSEVHKFY